LGFAGLLLTAVLLLQAGCAIVPTQQGDEDQSPEDEDRTGTVTVTGTGQVSVSPDQAVVVLGVETEADDAGTALNENNGQMQAVIDALTETGVAEENIQTEFFTLQPRYSQPSEGTDQQLVGFTAIHLARVEAPEVELVGDLLDAASAAGVNRIDSIRFRVSDPSEQLQQARNAAWQDAQQKAEQLASLAETELAAVVSIRESSSVPRPVEAALPGRGGAAAPIQPGQQDFQVQIEVEWSLQ
jgi:uncharacterized protein YggE